MATSLLVLTDFYKPANRALDYAANLAVAISAELVLLHVRRDSVLDPEMFTGQLSSQSQEIIDLALGSLASHVPGPVMAEVGHGRVASAVVEALSRHEPALVVLGLRDTGSTPDELVSTTALDLLRTAPHPMLIVPHDAPLVVTPRRVLLAVDGEDFTLGEHMGLVRGVFNALHAQLTVLHISPYDTDADEGAAYDSVARTGLMVDLPQVKTRTLMHPDAAEGILQVAATGEFDLLVLIARPRSFWGELFARSVTAQVLFNCSLPVLVLPAK